MTRRKRSLFVVLLGLTLALSSCSDTLSPTEPDSPGEGRVLNVFLARQQTDVWCWAAVSEMVLGYYGRPVAQCQILSAWYQADCCTFALSCRTTAPLQVIQQTLFAGGGLRSEITGPLSFPALAAEIDAGRPVIAAYRGVSGHVVVMYGYDPNGFVYIHDPLYGSHRVPYGTTFSYFGQLFWSETIFHIG